MITLFSIAILVAMIYGPRRSRSRGLVIELANPTGWQALKEKERDHG